MDNNVKVNINVTSNGTTDREIKKAKELHTAFDQAARAAGRVGTTGTAGSRAVAAKALPPTDRPTSQTIARDPVAAEVQQYGQQRGAAGMTGASARDFANQAQGLGGLVRLYATYAANIFAVGAAFRALSSAMDTTNMVQGLNQLGATTGRNLGSLSKSLVTATDGAISFRDAMESVAKATSAGMSSKDVMRLGDVAKNASLALGVSMPDAINRLTRGITKLEPELLDELGIFTKIDPAVEKYARTVGKAASQLTDFERRQAFANAVLTEGEEKFAAIAGIATNPYDKLLASLKNVLQDTLAFVNKGLVPLIDLLSSSPTALKAAVAGLGLTLLKQAIPAFGQFKAGLAAASEQAYQLSIQKAADASKAREALDRAAIKTSEDMANQDLTRLEALDRVSAVKIASIGRENAATRTLSKDLSDVSQLRLDRLKKLGEAYASSSDSKRRDEAAFYKDSSSALKNQIKSEQDLVSQKGRLEAERQKEIASRRTIVGLNQEIAKAADIDRVKKQIVSNAAYAGSLVGPTKALQLMNLELERSGLKLSPVEKGMLKAKGGVAAFAGAVGTVGTALNGALGWIGLLLTAVGFLDGVFSNAGKDIKKFNDALDTLESAAENANRTIDLIDKKGGFAANTVSSIGAMANAFAELSGSTETATTAAEKARKALEASRWDRIKDSIASGLGGGLDKNLAESLTKNIESAIRIIGKTDLDKEFEKELKRILQVEVLDTANITKGLLAQGQAGQQALSELFSKTNIEINNSASRLQEFSTATDAGTKAYQEFIQSTANTNPLFKVGTSVEAIALSMAKLTTGGVDELTAALIELAKAPEKGMLFGTTFVDNLVNIREEFLDQAKTLGVYKGILKDVNKEIERNQKILDAAPKRVLSTGEKVVDKSNLRRDEVKAVTAAEKAIPLLERQAASVSAAINVLPKDKIEAATKLFGDGIIGAINESSRLISVAVGQAYEKAGITLAKAQAGALSGRERAVVEGKINERELQIQLRAIDTSTDLIAAQERLRASIEENSAVTALATAKAEKAPPEKISGLEKQVEAAQIFKTIVSSLGKTGADIQKQIATIQDPIVAALVSARTLSIKNALAQQQATKIGVSADLQAQQQIITPRAKRMGEVEDAAKLEAFDSRRLQLAQSRSSIMNSIVGISNKETILAQAKVEQDQLDIRYKQEIRAIEVAIANAKEAGGAESAAEIKKQQNLLKQVNARKAEEQANLGLQTRKNLLDTNLEQLKRQTELTNALRNIDDIRARSNLDVLSAEADAFNSLYEISKQYEIEQKFTLETRRAQLDLLRQQRDVADNIRQIEAESKLKVTAAGTDTAAVKLIQDEAARQISIQQATSAGAQIEYEAKLRILEIQKQISLEQERYNELLNGAKSIAEQLSSVFGDLGTNIGNFVTSLADLTVNSEKRTQSLADAERKLAKAKDEAELDPTEVLKAEKEVAKTRAKNASGEFSDLGKMAGATKNFFKEKTAAYKIFQRTEQALHLASMAMKIKEMLLDKTSLVSKLATNAQEMASDAAGTVVSGVKAVVNAMSKLPFPLSLAAGAAMAAAVAGVLSQIGKSFKGTGGGGAAAAPSAEKRQEVQGSAIGFNAENRIPLDAQGNPITYRRGILGDPTAKSELIETSLELLANNSVDNLTVNNKMLAALYKIEAGIRGVSAGIVSIPGLTTGSLFNTQTGSSSTNFLGIFGSSKSREIIDSGLKFKGTLDELSTNAINLVSVFETVQTTSSRKILGFGRTKTSTSTEEDTLAERGTPQAERLALALEKTFSGIGDLLIEAAEASGVGGSVAKAVIGDVANALPVELQTFSTRGLKPDEIGPAFQAYLGSVSDFLGFKIFGRMFDEFAMAGEEIVQTVLRVIRTNELVGQSFANLGLTDFNDKVKQFTGLTGEDLTIATGRATQAMVDLAGGVDKFAERMQFIADNFVGEDQKLAATQRRLSTDLAKTGLIDTSLPENQRFNITTREEYIRVLDQINDAVARNVPGALELQNEFSNLSTVYDQLLPPLKASTKQIKEYTESITQQTTRIQKQIELLGATDYARTLNGITESFQDAIKTLEQQGMLTLDTLKLAYAQAQAQKELLDAQNARKANDLVVGLNAEVANMALGVLGKELLGITNKARDYAEQLINLNQATDENLAAIRAWEAAMIEAARSARREAQATQYAQLFSANQSDALAQKFAKLGFSLPSNIEQLQYLVDGIDTTTDAGLELRGKLLDLGSEFKSLIDSASSALRSAYDARVQEIKGAQDQFRNFAKSIKDFRQSLLTGAQSPLTPIGKYEQTKMEFERVAALASGGDIKAMEQLQSVSSSFLEASREVYASSELYTTDFNRVLTVVDNTASVAERQIEIADNTLQEMRNVVGSLIDISELTENGNVILTGLGPKLEQAIGNFTAISSQVDIAILQRQIDMANYNNQFLDNVVTSGVDQVRASTDSSTDAIKALTTLYADTQKIIEKRDLDINAQSILNTNAINWTLNANNTALLQALAPKPAPPPPPPPPIIEPIIYYYDYGNAGGAGGGFDIGGGFSGSGGGFSEGNGQDGGGQEGGPGASQAKGGAWLSGYQLFARGGIVDSPTLFNYARGKGIMGEAGPEAIMPLRRDAQGNLGVIAQQNNDELLAEIARLNQQVQQLTQVVAQGAVINAQATDRNTEAITTTIQTTATDKQYMKKVQSRTSIV